MKKLILLFSICLVVLTCGKDDESGETFLDKYNRTSWKIEGSLEGCTFSNETYFYMQYYGRESYLDDIDSIDSDEEDTFECMQYKEGTNVIFGMELIIKIQKNEANELSFDTTFQGQKLGTIKFTPQGENLVMTETSIEEGIETTTLISTDNSYYYYCRN